MSASTSPTGVTRSAASALAAAVVVLVVTAVWRQLRPPAALVAGSPIEELRRQADALRGYADDKAAAAGVRVAGLRQELWTDSRFESWKRHVPDHWTLQEAQAQLNASTLTRRFVLTRTGATSRDWAEIHGFLAQVNSLPTAVIQRLKLAMPQPQLRQFQEIEVVIDLWFEQPAAVGASARAEAVSP